MVAVAYPTASYPDDPLEIPVDPMTSIEMEVFHPNLVTHQAPSGAQFFLKRGDPRWRGTVSWAACYTNSRRAGAIEGYLMGLNEGIDTSTLKHGREVVNVSTINKRGDGSGTGSVTSVALPQGPGIEYMTGVRNARSRWIGRCYVDAMYYNRSVSAETYSGDASTNMVGSKVDDLSGTVYRLQDGARTLGYYFEVDTYRTSVWIRWGVLPPSGIPSRAIRGNFYELTTTQSGSNEVDTYNRYKRVPKALPLPTETSEEIKPGQVFKPTTGDYAGRLFMVTSVDDTNITFTPEIDIFGTASSVTLDQTDASNFITVRSVPGSSISLPRAKPMSGPWTLSWIEEG